MVLTDKDIRSLCEQKEMPLIMGFQEENLGAVSYDLTIKNILTSDKLTQTNYNLAPGEYVYVEMQEGLNMSDDLIGRIEEKNSRMRMGMVVSGPTYQPGHKTAIFLRVQNISSNIIVLHASMNIAQIVFEKLTQKPEYTYADRKDTAYNNEFDYTGYSSYESEYAKDIKKISKIQDSLEDKEVQIYGNILTFMGILMGIFSIITLNFEAFAKTKMTMNFIIAMNLTITLAIEFLMGIILIFINKNMTRKKLITYIVCVILTVGLLVGVSFFK